MRWMRDVATAGLVAVLMLGGQAVAEELEQIQVLFDGSGGVDGIAGATDVTVSPDGRNVYVTGAADNALAVFERDSAGELDHLQTLVNGVDAFGIGGANSVTVSEDGLHVYATGPSDNSVAVFERDLLLGTLTFVDRRQNGAGDVSGGLAGPTDVAVTPDGAHVYVTAQTFSTVAMFSRDPLTGSLDFLGFLQDGVDATGLSSASSLDVSPDGAYVYVTALGEDALSVFSRDPGTGLLSEVEVQREGQNGLEGISNPVKVDLSHDGEQVYVASFSDSAITVFERDTTTGALLFLEAVQDGVDGVVGLLSARSVAAGPGGARVYSVALDDNALSSFERDSDGLLTQYDLAVDGVAGVNGLTGPNAAAVSPDAEHVYTTSANEGSVAAFETNAPPLPGPPIPPLPPGSGSDLDGATMVFEWRFLSVDGALLDGPTPFQVGDGPELLDILSNANLDVSATNLRLDWVGNSNYTRTPPTFNGGLWTITSDTAPIEAVGVNGETNLAGFDLDRITFTDSEITVNLAGLNATPGSVVSVDIVLAPDAGAAGAWVAIAGLAALARRRRSIG